ncbi:MAG: rod shape-determining protein MreC [Bacteroidia bacterium]|nr:rod shape-determining protein MreC [Bacteroidia bacterium]NNF32170.1 rod shape-determining protein MreC [Flavobacteriaceae bacterium]MBT8276633.1 rod shape-determining protein MreC [Bacteroidia bacterium]NNJ80849.1 rod shape-determining protein MreC [Flavobacteriaceae bacterium]NNK55091.1 rod shape-determining protein MreC [Flavobacteriaceae bacterium]
MQQIIFFFIRNKNFLLFLLLFTISFLLTINSHSFHSNKVATSANFLSGGIYSMKQNFKDYFNLKTQNKILVEENNRLRQLLSNTQPDANFYSVDSTNILWKYNYVSARVINNSYSKSKNNLTLDHGIKDSIGIDMGVISSKGVVGIVNSVSANYATVQSVLNSNSQINAKLKNTDHFGTLVWQNGSPFEATLIDIPRQVQFNVGDTIVTDGKSTIFPEGILIGSIKDYKLAFNEDYYELTISLFNDMTNLRHVYVIRNKDAVEIRQLENALENVE